MPCPDGESVTYLDSSSLISKILQIGGKSKGFCFKIIANSELDNILHPSSFLITSAMFCVIIVGIAFSFLPVLYIFAIYSLENLFASNI